MRDIRELKDDPEAYAAELERRWNGLLSYRYIGRHYSSMNTGDIDAKVKLRHDMRNSTGGLLVAPIAISAPESGNMTDMEAVPNPVIYSCQILDPGQKLLAALIIHPALGGQRQAAGGAFQQPRAQPGLDPPDQLGQGGGCHPHLAGGLRKAAGLDHAQEGLHLSGPVVHARPICELVSKMKCKRG